MKHCSIKIKKRKTKAKTALLSKVKLFVCVFHETIKALA